MVGFARMSFLVGCMSFSEACSKEIAGEGGHRPGLGGFPASGSGGKGNGDTGGSRGAPGSGGLAPTSGGAPASGGLGSASGGAPGAGGGSASGGAPSSGGAPVPVGGTASGGASASGGAGGPLAKFSFFVTSIDALRTLSGNPLGFGGDLRFGETGEGAGLRGADKICTAIAEMSMPGSGVKTWRAFLSAKAGAAGEGVVNAIDRIGPGPWYDRLGRLFSSGRDKLIGYRPTDSDAAIKNDFPNESGVPNHTDGAPGCSGNTCPDNHDTLTGSGIDGKLYVSPTGEDPTCKGWTTAVGTINARPRVGHSWPRYPSTTMPCPTGRCNGNWMSSLDESGCAPGVELVERGGPMDEYAIYTVGSGGGYGGFYCFALVP